MVSVMYNMNIEKGETPTDFDCIDALKITLEENGIEVDTDTLVKVFLESELKLSYDEDWGYKTMKRYYRKNSN